MTGRQRIAAARAGEPAELAWCPAYPEIPFRDSFLPEHGQPGDLLDTYDAARCLPWIQDFLAVTGCDWWNVLWRPRPQPAWPRPSSLAECLDSIAVVPAETMLAAGQWDFARAHVEALGDHHFLYSYSSVPFALSFMLGFDETLLAVHDQPEFFRTLADRRVQQQCEFFHCMAEVGLDGVWIQDFYGGAELLSREHYRDLVLPGARDLVGTAHAEGLAAIHYFMGNAADRADLVAAAGADFVLFEEGRKGYDADLRVLGEAIGRNDTIVVGNLAAESVIAAGSEFELAAAVRTQLDYGRRRGRFVLGTGAPLTPATPWRRLAEVRELATAVWSDYDAS